MFFLPKVLCIHKSFLVRIKVLSSDYSYINEDDRSDLPESDLQLGLLPSVVSEIV